MGLKLFSSVPQLIPVENSGKCIPISVWLHPRCIVLLTTCFTAPIVRRFHTCYLKQMHQGREPQHQFQHCTHNPDGIEDMQQQQQRTLYTRRETGTPNTQRPMCKPTMSTTSLVTMKATRQPHPHSARAYDDSLPPSIDFPSSTAPSATIGNANMYL